MAQPTDPTFGSSFNPDTFRDKIKSAMQMGSPNATQEKVTFRWVSQKTYSVKTDPTGRPYDLASAAVSINEQADVQVDCAVEFIYRNPTGSPIGEFDTPRVVITLLDTDYAQIEGATKVLLGGNTYDVQFVEPPVGLFSVTVYTVHAIAVDES